MPIELVRALDEDTRVFSSTGSVSEIPPFFISDLGNLGNIILL